MSVDELITFFGSGRKACLALGISDRNFQRWNKQQWIPHTQQLRLEKITEGLLKADLFGKNRRPLQAMI